MSQTWNTTNGLSIEEFREGALPVLQAYDKWGHAVVAVDVAVLSHEQVRILEQSRLFRRPGDEEIPDIEATVRWEFAMADTGRALAAMQVVCNEPVQFEGTILFDLTDRSHLAALEHAQRTEHIVLVFADPEELGWRSLGDPGIRQCRLELVTRPKTGLRGWMSVYRILSGFQSDLDHISRLRRP